MAKPTTRDRRDDITTDRDHVSLSDTKAARRYFNKFAKITGHLRRVAGAMEAEGKLGRNELEVLARYAMALTFTFRALSNKYMFIGRMPKAGQLMFDREESGFPVFNELLLMANDAQQAKRHLEHMPSSDALKQEMVRKIVGEQEIPTKLQFALSQRLYYEELLRGELFWAKNDPEAIWLGTDDQGRRKFLLHWAVYDSQVNLPTVYLMEVEDSGRTSLSKDTRRWPEAQAHLMGQSMDGLKLVTIAKGFDEGFDDLHPKRLRRFHMGPMYSSTFTTQRGPLREVLTEAKSPPGEDWAMAWTTEELLSDRVTEERSGWFGTVEREIFALDPFSGRGADTGATSTERSIILPQRAYQVLEEKSPPGFASVRKFVVSPQGRVLSYR